MSLDSIDCKVIDSFPARMFREEICSQNFIEAGHFKVSNTHCVHDWFNCKKLLTSNRINELVVDSIVEDIKKSNSESEEHDKISGVVFGIDSTGFLLASRIAVALSLPFSSYIPSRYRNEISDMDRNIFGDFAKDCNQIFLITDVVIFGETIASVIDEIKKVETFRNKQITIYTLFLRNSVSQINSGLAGSRLRFFSDRYKATIINKEECVYNLHGNCIDTKKPTIPCGG